MSSTSLDSTYTDSSGPQEKALRVNPSPTETEFDGVHTPIADDDANDNGHDDDIQPALHYPLLDCLAYTASKSTNSILFSFQQANCTFNGSRNCLFEVDISQIRMTNQIRG